MQFFEYAYQAEGVDGLFFGAECAAFIQGLHDVLEAGEGELFGLDLRSIGGRAYWGSRGRLWPHKRFAPEIGPIRPRLPQHALAVCVDLFGQGGDAGAEVGGAAGVFVGERGVGGTAATEFGVQLTSTTMQKGGRPSVAGRARA